MSALDHQKKPVSPKNSAAPLGSGNMFDPLAKRYERVNTILSLGQDKRWRKTVIREVALQPGEKALDLATGTAQIALGLCQSQPQAQVFGLDPSKGMLQWGYHQIKQKVGTLTLLQGDAQTLPFLDESFDVVTISFGIRNFKNREKALLEIARVLKPKGRLVILEFSEPQTGFFSKIARFHIRHILPWLGGLLASKEEYAYLQKSIEQFPTPALFTKMIQNAGFQMKQTRPLTFGVCYLYLSQKM